MTMGRRKYSCRALEGMTVSDVLGMERFLSNLAAYWTQQRESRLAAESSYRAMHKLGTPKGYKLPSHPIVRLMHLSAEDMAVEYGKVVQGGSSLSHAEREYVYQLGRQAYNLTVAQLIVDEHPELEAELLPKADAS